MPIPMPVPGANALLTVTEEGDMVVEKNVDVSLKDGKGLVRANVYRPKAPGRYPVLMTCEFVEVLVALVHQTFGSRT